MAGPALVFEGEESMITAISENPANFKVIWLIQKVQFGHILLQFRGLKYKIS